MRSIKGTLSEHSTIVLSWGCKNIIETSKSCSFDVSGYLFQGRVLITYSDEIDKYQIEFCEKEKATKREVQSVSYEDIVKVIDYNVEYDENYTERVTIQPIPHCTPINDSDVMLYVRCAVDYPS